MEARFSGTLPPHYGIFCLLLPRDRQGRSGLGLDAQKQAVHQCLDGGRWQLVAQFVEIESGKRAKRPQLDAALAVCGRHKAKLVVPGLSTDPLRETRFASTAAGGFLQSKKKPRSDICRGS